MAASPGTKKDTDNTARRLGIAIVVVLGGLDRAEPVGEWRRSRGRRPRAERGRRLVVRHRRTRVSPASRRSLAHYGHPISRQRGALADAILDPTGTIFVIEPQTLTDADDTALLQFVSAGGRLVIGDSEPFYLHRLRDRPPVWTPDGDTSYRQFDAQLGNLTEVQAAGRGSWMSPGSGTVVLAHRRRRARHRSRTSAAASILFVADASPLENAYLGLADNAAFALGLAGDAPRPVEFVGRRARLRREPGAGSLADAVEGGADRARRGRGGARVVAEPAVRTTRPAGSATPAAARAEYVRALAVSLERTHDPEHALAPMQQWARSHIAQRAHLRPDASLEEVDRAAIALGYSESERAAIWHPATDETSALALGRLVSQLSQHDGRTT